jgi:hypothetical protein
LTLAEVAAAKDTVGVDTVAGGAVGVYWDEKPVAGHRNIQAASGL